MYSQTQRKPNEDMEKLIELIPFYKSEELYSNYAAANKPRTARMINEKINEKENILIIIETNVGNKFGAYFSKKINIENRFVMDDPNHFVFTLQNNMNIKPRIYKRRAESILPLMCLCNDNEEGVILTIPGFCWISDNNSVSFIYRNFGNVYEDDGDGYAVFCKDEIKMEKKENASIVSINSIKILQLSLVPQNHRIELSTQLNFNKEKLIDFVASYGKANVEVGNNFATIVFEHVKEALYFMKSAKHVSNVFKCSVKIKSVAK